MSPCLALDSLLCRTQGRTLLAIDRLTVARGERLAIIAGKGMANPWVHTNPRKISGPAELEALLNQAWD